MGSLARGIGNIFESAALEQVVVNFQRRSIHQVAPHCSTLTSYTMAANCAPGALAMTTCGTLSLVDGLRRAV